MIYATMRREKYFFDSNNNAGVNIHLNIARARTKMFVATITTRESAFRALGQGHRGVKRPCGQDPKRIPLPLLYLRRTRKHRQLICVAERFDKNDDKGR